MNRLARFRFGNLHKGRLLGVLILITLMMVGSGLFLFFIGFFGRSAELPRVTVSADLTSERCEGVGINILEVPDANIIDDPFFDKKDLCMYGQVIDAHDNYIYFDPSGSDAFSGMSSGDEVNILSIDEYGRMGLRYSGNAAGFSETMFSYPEQIGGLDNLMISDPAVKSCRVQGTLFLLTSSGRLIADASLDPRDISDGIVFSDICAEGINLYSLTGSGDIYVNSDTGTPALLGNVFTGDGVTAEHIAVINGNILCFMSDGQIRAFTSSGSVDIGHVQAARIACGSGFMACTDGCDVYVSFNGIYVKKLEGLDECIPEGDDISQIEAYGQNVFILTEYGKVISADLTDSASVLNCRDISSIEPVSLCPSGPSHIIAVSSDHQTYRVSMETGNISALGNFGISADDVMISGEGLYIIRSGNKLYEASLMSAIVVDQPVADGVVMAGDTCIVKHSSADVSDWDIYGNTGIEHGNEGISLTGFDDGLHAMSVQLEAPVSELFRENLFYRIEVEMSGSADIGECDIWLEGETFGDEGMHITDLSQQLSPYSYVFAVTDSMLSDEYLRFNISFEGEGVIEIRSVYAGLDRYDLNSVPAEFTDMINRSAPSALRFQDEVIGGQGSCEERYYGTGASSLECAMQICKSSGADPWLVMGPSVVQSDVDGLLGYLSGSVTNGYGKLRIDNGTALPWSRQFDTIYIEINDNDGAFLSDAGRGAYVTYVMGLFAKSEFYTEIKDRIVFIDGMEYEGGVMLSEADRHASAVFIDGGSDFDTASAEAFEAADYAAPRTSGVNAGGEFIRSLKIGGSSSGYNAADIVSAVIRAESGFAEIIMVDSDVDVSAVVASLKPLTHGVLAFCETAQPIDPSSEYTAEAFDEACDVMLVDHESSVCLVVSNSSDQLQQFIVASDTYDLSDGSYSRYSPQGSLLIRRDLDRMTARQLLQPGEYMVIEIPK